MSSIIRARSGLMGWWEASEVIRGASLELKVAGPSMLGIRRPDRHALPLATSPTRRQRFTHPPPAGAGSFFAPFRPLARPDQMPQSGGKCRSLIVATTDASTRYAGQCVLSEFATLDALRSPDARHSMISAG